VTTDRPLRAALYARISTVGHGQDAGLQLDELRQVAAQRGWTIAGEFADLGVSGTVDSRPELDRMMAEARAGKLDLIAVFRFDRFARDTRHLLVSLEELRCLGVDFISLREQVDTSTPMGKAMFTIIAAVAQLERDIIRERVIAGVRRAQAAGKHCGRPRVEMDLRPALALLREGRSLKEAARILQVSRNTLRRRLREAGEWPINSTASAQPSLASMETNPP
jgi:DNA invertase Pin-like site-specific DNA recombinase